MRSVRCDEHSVGNFWTLHHAQLYSEPERLAGAGLVREEREAGGRRRRTYSVTDAGRAALDAWLQSPAEVPGELRDPGLLQPFFGAERGVLAGPQEALHAAKLDEYERLHELAAGRMPVGERLALEAGIAHEREWALLVGRRCRRVGSRAVRSIDLRFQGSERVITSWLVDGVLIDPGPESCLDTLLAGLGEERPRAILLTHIHFDHAGATGALLRAWPEVPVFVHERGAPHMASPERLLASTARLIGEDGIRARWGGMSPVPEASLRPLSGGERILDQAFRVAYTPGHAVHHVAYLHEDTGWALVGDVAGVRIAEEAAVIAPTPPPDVDLVAWPASLRVLREWDPAQTCLSHSGAVTETAGHLDALEASLALQSERARELESDAFARWYRGYLGERMSAEAVELYLEASPVEHMWRGLRRWHERRARRTSGR